MKIKSNKVYHIKFTKLVDTGNTDDFTHPIYGELSQLIEKDEQCLIGFTDSEDLVARVLDFKLKEICSLFEKHGFEFDVIDVTQEVINGQFQKEYPEVQVLTPNIFDDFRFDYLTVDDVLDKINETGIDSLDDIDKKILKKA
jgi:hypothetical protein